MYQNCARIDFMVNKMLFLLFRNHAFLLYGSALIFMAHQQLLHGYSDFSRVSRWETPGNLQPMKIPPPHSSSRPLFSTLRSAVNFKTLAPLYKIGDMADNAIAQVAA